MSTFVNLEESELSWLRESIASESARAVAKKIGISEFTVCRMAAGVRVQRLTARVFRKHVASTTGTVAA